MITELREDDFPEIYERFVKLLNGKPWIKATQNLEYQLRDNPFTRPQIERDNREAFGLAFFEKYGMRRPWDPAWSRVQEAMNFAAQICDMVERSLDDRGANAYLGRVVGAFKNARDMRALRLEHQAAVHFYSQGAVITWPDECRGAETFDLLASGLTPVPIEVECKSCSRDKGHQITEKLSADFWSEIRPQIKGAVTPGEALLIRIVVPKKLPTKTSAIKLLAREVMQAISTGLCITAGGHQVFVHRSQPGFLTLNPVYDLQQRGLYFYAQEIMGGMLGYRWFEVHGTSGIVVEVCSRQANTPLDSIRETAKKAIRGQMTGNRPGCLILKIEDMSKAEFGRLLEGEFKALDAFAGDLFNDEQHQHLACLVFTSEESMENIGSEFGVSQSCIWVADRQVGKYANLGIGRILLSPGPAVVDATKS
ncbi:MULTISPECIES: hypothetical protein [Pseudomonas]|uniref:Uncharacterized protein n=1 Tax=Pseudomonas nitroreducens TaxID=46680 RepID=A0A6G6J8K3_PSENT|nr:MULTISPECIES: hypothetical protein [Pseudomonas]MDU4255620.1 hypothetical protein [Pseudomonas sp.]QIE91400.1 hypothetical protein G5B91_34210 [Pseudomonas nitroreducens]HBO6301710.1 hypothetical protein [Pseudomonas aeruginosa]